MFMEKRKVMLQSLESLTNQSILQSNLALAFIDEQYQTIGGIIKQNSLSDVQKISHN